MTLGEVLISESDIQHVIQEIVGEIKEDYGDEEIVLVGVMDGAVCFLADLMRAFPESVDVLTVRVTSYEGTEAGEIKIDWLPSNERVDGKHVLIVEDIVDTGATAVLLMEKLAELGAASVEICALLDKPSRREHDVEVAYAGFDVPNVFVVGYGLDYNGAFRNLPHLQELEGGE